MCPSKVQFIEELNAFGKQLETVGRNLLFSDPCNLVGGSRYMTIFVCESARRSSVVLINIPSLLLIKYVKVASMIGDRL
jgi:hypothetical protein